MKTKILIIGAFVAFTIFISCDSNDKTQESTAISTDQVAIDSKIDASIDDVSAIAEDQFSIQQNQTAKTSETIRSILPTCAVVTGTLNNDGVYTKTIDFGTDGCTLKNGNVIKGKIIISFSNNFTALEQNISYSFDGFYHNGNKIQGNKTIVRTFNSTEVLTATHPVFTNTLDMTVTFENGKVYTRTGNRVNEMVEGYDTKSNWEDNVFLVTGTSTTTTASGEKFSSTIQTPLRFVMSCQKPFPVSGTVLKTKNDSEALINFGTGDCDNLATVTIGGVTTTIELKK